VERVKAMHETGGAGSIGYRYDWKREEAEKYILRTHTTAVSARMLYEVANVRWILPCELLVLGWLLYGCNVLAATWWF
jgi:phenylalanyl-tRNA synthetase alpha subunit